MKKTVLIALITMGLWWLFGIYEVFAHRLVGMNNGPYPTDTFSTLFALFWFTIVGAFLGLAAFAIVALVTSKTMKVPTRTFIVISILVAIFFMQHQTKTGIEGLKTGTTNTFIDIFQHHFLSGQGQIIMFAIVGAVVGGIISSIVALFMFINSRTKNNKTK